MKSLRFVIWVVFWNIESIYFFFFFSISHIKSHFLIVFLKIVFKSSFPDKEFILFYILSDFFYDLLHKFCSELKAFIIIIFRVYCCLFFCSLSNQDTNQHIRRQNRCFKPTWFLSQSDIQKEVIWKVLW